MPPATDTPSLSRTLLIIAVMALLLVLLVWQLPRWLQAPDGGARAELIPAEPCDINLSRCSADTDQIRISFGLTPRPIRSLETLNADLQLEGVNAEQVTLSLEGRDMYMGINQVSLTPGAQSGQWLGTTELALCSTGTMVWRARLDIIGAGRHLTTWFDFEAR